MSDLASSGPWIKVLLASDTGYVDATRLHLNLAFIRHSWHGSKSVAMSHELIKNGLAPGLQQLPLESKEASPLLSSMKRKAQMTSMVTVHYARLNVLCRQTSGHLTLPLSRFGVILLTGHVSCLSTSNHARPCNAIIDKRSTQDQPCSAFIRVRQEHESLSSDKSLYSDRHAALVSIWRNR